MPCGLGFGGGFITPPLRDNASIRDFHRGAGCHVASVLEEALLLPTDMAELQLLTFFF